MALREWDVPLFRTLPRAQVRSQVSGHVEGVRGWRTAEGGFVKLGRQRVGVGQNREFTSLLCSAFRTPAFWQLLWRRHIGGRSQQALFPNPAERAENGIVYHVDVAGALACARKRQRRETV